MIQSEQDQSKITWWPLLIYVGSILLIVGNTLPWPCPPGVSFRDCTVLVTHRLSVSWYGIMLAVGVLLLPIAVYVFRPPFNTIYWVSFWLLIYLLLVHKLYPVDSGGAFPRFYLSLVPINRDLGGPTSLVMPLSLFTFWLVIRPRHLQKRWWIAELFSLLTLIATVAYFLIVIAQRVQSARLTPSPFFDQHIFGSGPWVILVGGVLLLGALIFERSQQQRRAVFAGSAVAPAVIGKSRKAYRVGTWAAVTFAAATFLPFLIYSAGELASLLSPLKLGEAQLFTALLTGVAYLRPLSLIVLMGCLHITAPAEKKIWGRFGVISAILYAILAVASGLFLSLIIRQYPEFYTSLTNSIPLLTRLGGLGTMSAAFLSLAGLFSVPLLTKRGIELAACWCFVASGVLTIVGIVGMLLSTSRIPDLPLVITQTVNALIFPVAIAMLAVGLRRRVG